MQSLRAENYQEAQALWEKIHQMDPSFPDPQKIETAVRRKLKEVKEGENQKRKLPVRWLVGGGALVLIVVIGTFVLNNLSRDSLLSTQEGPFPRRAGGFLERAVNGEYAGTTVVVDGPFTGMESG